MRNLDFDTVDRDLMRRILGAEAEAALEEMARFAKILEEAGLAKRNGNDIQLTPRGIRRMGERALKDLFAELRQDRHGQHEQRDRGSSAEQVHETKPWEFGDPFLVDIGASLGNAIRRSGPGLPVSARRSARRRWCARLSALVTMVEYFVTGRNISTMSMSSRLVSCAAPRPSACCAAWPVTTSIGTPSA